MDYPKSVPNIGLVDGKFGRREHRHRRRRLVGAVGLGQRGH